MRIKVDRQALAQNLESIIEESTRALTKTFPFVSDDDNEEQQQQLAEEGTEKFRELFSQSYIDVLGNYRGLGSQLSNLRSTFLPIELIRSVKSNVADATNQLGQASSIGQIEEIKAKKFLIEIFLKIHL